MRIKLILIFLLPLILYSQGDSLSLHGTIKDIDTQEPIGFTYLKLLENHQTSMTDASGYYEFDHLGTGSYHLVVYATGYRNDTSLVQIIESHTEHNLKIETEIILFDALTVSSEKSGYGAVGKMKPIEGVMIAHGKKAEVIRVDQVGGNLATNNARQIYATIPGLNIWESDGAGIQLGIGGRGLSPSRTANYNTRQNGYDISADALGYPESYYTPPAQAISEIQFIKGAGSLQFGPQFGGVINFKLRNGSPYKSLTGQYQKTYGSFGVTTSYLDFGGSHGRWKYFLFGNRKIGNEWRPNSDFELVTGGLNIAFSINEKATINAEFTKMNYIAQQSGGLTDLEFKETPFISKRTRNWFSVDWNLWSINYKHSFNARNTLNSKFFGLGASRKALGFLGQINRVDPMEERNLIVGEFNNIGNETKFLKIFDINEIPQALLLGIRIYKGYSIGEQGYADQTDQPNFFFLGESDFEHSYYEFPSKNTAVFMENILRVNDKTSFIPGIRAEYISTQATGNYNSITYDLAGNIIDNSSYHQELKNERSFVIFGLGFHHKIKGDTIALYANFSQNYRSINFTDMQISNPNFRIDPDLKDETGWNADFGLKGNIEGFVYYDLSIYSLFYNNRIGTTIQKDSLLFNTYQFRTNISQSISAGFEGFLHLNWLSLSKNKESHWKLQSFLNYSYSWARYIGDNELYDGNFVELVPPVNYKIGSTVGYKKFELSTLFNWVHWHYSDASNSLSQPNAVNGIIPTYYVLDLNAKLSVENVDLKFGVSNVLNEVYFTRRATSYPGPGIITSAPRNYYLTLVLNF